MPHIHEKIDFTVEVFVVYKKKVLLRMHDKFKMWLSVGGHIELGEDPVEAALREVKEEVGLDVEIIGESKSWDNDMHEYRELIPPRHMGRHKVTDTHDHIMLLYFAKSKTDIIKDSKHNHEKALTRWATKEELDTMDLVPNVRFYAEEALKELSE